MKRRLPPVEIVGADAEAPNAQNPHEGCSAADRSAKRVAVLGTRIAGSWEAILELTELKGGGNDMNSERLLTAKEIWEQLAISERQFYRWAKRVDLPCVRFGRVTRYRWQDVQQALAKCRQETNPPTQNEPDAQ